MFSNLIASLDLLQKKQVKKKKPKKKPSAVDITPKALEESWVAVAEELRATGCQVIAGNKHGKGDS